MTIHATALALLMSTAAAQAATRAPDASVFYDLFDGVAELSTIADTADGGTLDFVLGFDADVLSVDGGFLEVDNSDGLLVATPLSVAVSGATVQARFAVDADATTTGAFRDVVATIAFTQPFADLAPDAEYVASVTVAPIPLPAGAGLLAGGLVGLGWLGRLRRGPVAG